MITAEQRLSYIKDVAVKLAEICDENSHSYRMKNWPELERRAAAQRDAYLYIASLIDVSESSEVA